MSEIVARGNYPIFFENNSMIVSHAEREFLEAFLASSDLENSAAIAGMSLPRAKDFLGSDRIKRYVESKIEQMGRRNAITLDTVLDRLHKVAWGELKITRYEMKALEILSSYLSILKPTVQVAVGVKIDSPLAPISDATLDAMIAERASATRQVS